jgi:hypothetical protein
VRHVTFSSVWLLWIGAWLTRHGSAIRAKIRDAVLYTFRPNGQSNITGDGKIIKGCSGATMFWCVWINRKWNHSFQLPIPLNSAIKEWKEFAAKPHKASFLMHRFIVWQIASTKLYGFSPGANYTDRATAWCRVVSAMDPLGRILGVLDRSRHCFFQVALQLYSRGWVHPVPDPLLLRNSGSPGHRTRTSRYVARNSDH